MRNTIIIFLLSLSFTLLFTTCKNPGIDYNTFSITEENIQPGVHNVMVSGEYDFLGEVMNMKLNIGLNEQLTDAESHSMNLDNQSFSITVDNLKPSTSYYYCYVVEFDNNHKLLTDVDIFKTLSEKPVVRILEAHVVDSTKISVKCIVDDDFGMDITERGICWNHTGNPSLNDNHVANPVNGNGLGEYTCEITSHPLNPPYYIRAYAKNRMGTSYSDQNMPIEKPTVETLPTEASAITQTSATCMGRIVKEGSSPIIQCGICWGTTSDPIHNGVYSPSVSNENILVALSELTPGTTYYYCAYAINNVGTGYGTILNFNTNKGEDPVVRIDEIEETLTGTVVCNCFVEDEGSSSISERGVCWSTSHNPTITDNHLSNGSGAGSYTINLTNLTEDETYYVCAYAKNNDGHIGYSNEVPFEMKKIFTVSVSAEPNGSGTLHGGGRYFRGDSCTVTAEPNTGYRFQYWAKDNIIILESTHTFTVTSGVSLVAHFNDSPVGTIGGSFTIDYNGNKVWFSQGNLQYNAFTQTWQFASQQYEIIGNGNSNISETYNGWIDLFGWATSGYDSNNVNCQPWCNSSESSGYGPSGLPGDGMPGELTGNMAYYDWGVNNPISNGGDQPNLWRTLSKNEWFFILKERNASTVNGIPNARFVKARVNNVFGVVLFPDEYTHPTGIGQPTGINVENTNENNYSTTEFALMQAAGAVFLPAAGKRYVNTVNELDIVHYWSVTYDNRSTAYELKYDPNSLNDLNPLKLIPRVRCDGLSVRLVCPFR